MMFFISKIIINRPFYVHIFTNAVKFGWISEKPSFIQSSNNHICEYYLFIFLYQNCMLFEK